MYEHDCNHVSHAPQGVERVECQDAKQTKVCGGPEVTGLGSQTSLASCSPGVTESQTGSAAEHTAPLKAARAPSQHSHGGELCFPRM